MGERPWSPPKPPLEPLRDNWSFGRPLGPGDMYPPAPPLG